MKTADYLPRWTKRAFIKGTGRDPLALSRVSGVFTDLLLPSIITATSRARYYSFYPWAIRDGALMTDREGSSSTDPNEALRRRESAFAMASQLENKTGLSIVGSNKVREKLAEVTDVESVSVSFKVLPSNETGGFGQNYGACLSTLKIIDWDGGEDRDEERDVNVEVDRDKEGDNGDLHVNEKRGAKLADAFAHAISSTPYEKLGYSGKAELPLSVLRDSSELFSLDAIRRPEAKDERELLTDIFFDMDDDSDLSVSSYRQTTLGQLLHVLHAYETLGSLPARNDIEGSCIFWPHYYGSLYGADGQSVPYNASPAFEDSSAFWRQFCVHQFFTYAVEEVLQSILDAVSQSAEGMLKADLVNALLASEFVDELKAVTGRSELLGLSQLIDYFMDAGSPEEVQQKFSANHDLAEWWIYDKSDTRDGLTTRLGRAFGILAQLYAKWRHSDDKTLLYVGSKAGEEWWVGTCFKWGDQWNDSFSDWETAVSDLVDEVYMHHELIKFQKGRLDAAWVEKNDDGYYSKMQDLTPGFRSNRHPNVATVFQDLCILEDGGTSEALQLTDFGRATLEKVIQVRSKE